MIWLVARIGLDIAAELAFWSARSALGIVWYAGEATMHGAVAVCKKATGAASAKPVVQAAKKDEKSKEMRENGKSTQ